MLCDVTTLWSDQLLLSTLWWWGGTCPVEQDINIVYPSKSVLVQKGTCNPLAWDL